MSEELLKHQISTYVSIEADLPYIFRPYTPEDINFILHSWGSSYYQGGNYVKYLSTDEFHFFHRPRREELFRRPNSTAIVCVSKENENLILGWALVEKPKTSAGLILHYVYVKQSMKEMGIANGLIASLTFKGPLLFTHLTKKAQKIMTNNKPKYQHYFYAPHLL